MRSFVSGSVVYWSFKSPANPDFVVLSKTRLSMPAWIVSPSRVTFTFARRCDWFCSNAYGSINWALLFAHGYTTLLDVFDTAALVVLCVFLEPEEKHYVDITENSFFWYFVVATWIPLYLMIFLGPRF